jgi:DHA1 family multidrug resistance protein-like MFS transporter
MYSIRKVWRQFRLANNRVQSSLPCQGLPRKTVGEASVAMNVRARQHWVVALILFGIASMVEGLGVSQIFAFMPLYLRGMGMPEADIPQWVGWLNSLIFIFGLPLVPLWGVWADKYSRKAVIARSALVEAIVYLLVGLSRHPWQLGGSLLLVGFQLGNTGVMLSALRDVVPRQRLGTAIAIFSATSPIGFAAGPALGSFMVDRLHTSLSAVYALSALLSVGVVVLLALGLQEVRPEVIPTGHTVDLAYGAIKGVFTDVTTRRLFTVFGIAVLARFMTNPFVPIVTEHVSGSQVELASAIALVVGTAALTGGLISPIAGAVGDRVGFRPVLVASLVGYGVVLALMPEAPGVPLLALLSATASAFNGGVGAMVFGLLAMEVPPEQRSATLNLVYFPLYIAGIIGPAVGALVVRAGLPAVFTVSGLVLGMGALYTVARLWRSGDAPGDSAE